MPSAGTESPEQRRQRLLDAARDVLRERGFDADIREILSHAGVGTGTAYRHFSNTEALVRAVLAQLGRELDSGLAAAGAVPDARGAIAEVMRVGFRMLARYGQIIVAFFGAAPAREYADAIDCRAIVGSFQGVLERGIAQGHFPADLDVNHAIGVWLGLFSPVALAGSDGRPREPDEVAAASTRFFLNGISADREPARS